MVKVRCAAAEPTGAVREGLRTLGTELSGHYLRAVQGDVDDHHGGSRLGLGQEEGWVREWMCTRDCASELATTYQRVREGPPDPLTATGDESALAVEPEAVEHRLAIDATGDGVTVGRHRDGAR